MLTAEILCVGTELLMGQVVNTNAAHIAKRLCDTGIAVNYYSVVGDNPKRLYESIETAIGRVDVVITTGGLGPTNDDITKETVASVLGAELVFHKESMDRMSEYFKHRKRSMSSNNEKQAYLPKGSIVLENMNGTAPGCILEKDGKMVVMLPGPPREMVPMLESAIGYLSEKSGMVMKSRVLRMFGIGESKAAEICDDIIKSQTNPTIAPYAKEGEVTFRITASAENEEKAVALVDEMAEKVYERLGEYIYGEGDDNSMENVVVQALRKKGLTLSTAESCTGGMIGEMITRISGASEVYKYGFVTYANEAKEKLVGVKKETLDEFTAVSYKTAREMAEGARQKSGADIAVSVTGYAGPGEGAGLVYIGVSDKNGTESFEFMHSGDRERVRKKSALCALDIVRKRIEQL